MQTRIREVRKAKGLTLAEVAARCSPPTTAQTIGRLETGTRTVSVGWLNRIAAALGVDPSELVSLPDRPDVPVAAILGPAGAEAPRRPMMLAAPSVQADLIGMTVEATQGEYRAGDEIWLTRVAPEAFALGLNKDVLVPLPEDGPGVSAFSGGSLGGATGRGAAGGGAAGGGAVGGPPEARPSMEPSGGKAAFPDASSGTRPDSRLVSSQFTASQFTASRFTASRFVFGRLVAVGSGSSGSGPSGSGSNTSARIATTPSTQAPAAQTHSAKPPSAQAHSAQAHSAQVLQILPLAWGAQPVIVPAPEWIAVVSVLMRKL